MNRAETTKLLSILLYQQKLSGSGKCWKKEVCLDYGTKDVRRVDYMEFVPQGKMSISDLEKGIFICYEVKSCLADYKSGYGRNFIGEKNYYVMPMELFKKVTTDIPMDIGVLVPVPATLSRKQSDIWAEVEDPTVFKGEAEDWRLHEIRKPTLKVRKKSMVELLFAMLIR